MSPADRKPVVIAETAPGIAYRDTDGPDESLRLEVFRSFSECTIDQSTWDDSVERLGGSLYFTYDWVRTWWDEYGGKSRLRIYLIRQADQLVGILPFYIQRLYAGVCFCRVARLVGANLPAKAFDPPLDPRCGPEAGAMAIDRLYDEEDVDLVSFGPVTRLWLDERHAAIWGRDHGAGHDPVWAEEDVVTRFDLPETFDAYLATLEKKERQERMRRVRQLHRAVAVETRLTEEKAGETDALEQFALRHAAQWRPSGRGGHFDSWPHGLPFHRALVRRQSMHGRVLFFQLIADNEVVADRYVYRWAGVLYSELPARSIGTHWDRLGLGTTSMVLFLEDAIQRGFRQVHSGIGHYDYKVRLRGREIPVGTLRFVRRRPFSRLRAAVLWSLARAIIFLVRKVWHRRLVPRLPLWVSRSQPLIALRYDL